MKKITFLFAALFCVQVLSAQEQPLTVSRAIDYALKNNPGIAAAKKNAESAFYAANAAKANYLPRVDITALAVKLDDSVYLDLNDIRRAVIGAGIISGGNPAVLEQSIPSFEKKILDDTFVRVAATLTQPVFTGFKVSANAKIKKLEKDISEINLQTAKNSVITSVVEDYYRVKLADKVIEIRADYQKNIENHVANAKKLFNGEMISKANLLKAEVALAQAKKDYQKSLNDKELASILLNNTLGIKTEDTELASPMEMISGLKDADFYVSKALNGNGSLKLLNGKKLMLKQKHKAAIGSLLPAIAAIGEYQILRDDLTMLEPEWAVGITASINIFGGGADFNNIKASKAEIEAVDAQIKSVQNLIYTGVKRLYHLCKTAKEDYEALETNKTLAEENLKLYRASFKEGLATSLEVVDAELALAKIKTDQAKAVFDYNAAYAGLLNICAQSELGFAQSSGE
ncbi:MAG: TolC family protein [Endomicrobium sp.]|jgi:outer membrane protein TolC|nr:TolC family protein [Endomicrobium sp.]